MENHLGNTTGDRSGLAKKGSRNLFMAYLGMTDQIFAWRALQYRFFCDIIFLSLVYYYLLLSFYLFRDNILPIIWDSCKKNEKNVCFSSQFFFFYFSFFCNVCVFIGIVFLVIIIIAFMWLNKKMNTIQWTFWLFNIISVLKKKRI